MKRHYFGYDYVTRSVLLYFGKFAGQNNLWLLQQEIITDIDLLYVALYISNKLKTYVIHEA